MNKELQYISSTLKATLDGDPWYGKPVYTVLDETDPKIVYQKPDSKGHSIAELLYHMIIWAEFTVKRLEKDPEYDEKYYAANDWQKIDPAVHTWQKGVKRFKDVHKQLLAILAKHDDSLLGQKVDFREYNFRHLLHGFTQHNIYHLGQITYVDKLLKGNF